MYYKSRVSCIPTAATRREEVETHMITAELRRVPDAGGDYEVVATIQVDDDGTYRVDDPEGHVPTYLRVLAPAAGPEQLQSISLEDDPETWVRHLDSVLRTGYLVPVITHDSRDGRDADSQLAAAGAEELSSGEANR